jgi:hypothetical protein
MQPSSTAELGCLHRTVQETHTRTDTNEPARSALAHKYDTTHSHNPSMAEFAMPKWNMHTTYVPTTEQGCAETRIHSIQQKKNVCKYTVAEREAVEQADQH